jgi:hypothetical protein
MATSTVYRQTMATHCQRLARVIANLFADVDTLPTPELFRRIGVFSVSVAIAIADPELFQDVLRQVVVIHAESLNLLDQLDYIGFSDAFDIVPDGAIPPIYAIHCTRHHPGIDPAGVPMPACTTFEFVRQEAK